MTRGAPVRLSIAARGTSLLLVAPLAIGCARSATVTASPVAGAGVHLRQSARRRRRSVGRATWQRLLLREVAGPAHLDRERDSTRRRVHGAGEGGVERAGHRMEPHQHLGARAALRRRPLVHLLRRRPRRPAIHEPARRRAAVGERRSVRTVRIARHALHGRQRRHRHGRPLVDRPDGRAASRGATTRCGRAGRRTRRRTRRRSSSTSRRWRTRGRSRRIACCSARPTRNGSAGRSSICRKVPSSCSGTATSSSSTPRATRGSRSTRSDSSGCATPPRIRSTHRTGRRAGPVFTGNAEVFGVGHASFVTTPDESEHWIVYHSKDSPTPGWKRSVRMQRFDWSPDGEPRFGAGGESRGATPAAEGRVPLSEQAPLVRSPSTRPAPRPRRAGPRGPCPRARASIPSPRRACRSRRALPRHACGSRYSCRQQPDERRRSCRIGDLGERARRVVPQLRVARPSAATRPGGAVCRSSSSPSACGGCAPHANRPRRSALGPTRAPTMRRSGLPAIRRRLLVRVHRRRSRARARAARSRRASSSSPSTSAAIARMTGSASRSAGIISGATRASSIWPRAQIAANRMRGSEPVHRPDERGDRRTVLDLADRPRGHRADGGHAVAERRSRACRATSCTSPTPAACAAASRTTATHHRAAYEAARARSRCCRASCSPPAARTRSTRSAPTRAGRSPADRRRARRWSPSPPAGPASSPRDDRRRRARRCSRSCRSDRRSAHRPRDRSGRVRRAESRRGAESGPGR